jgi:transcriptional antiterminator RfaH
MTESTTEPTWYVVQSKPRQETLAAARVERLDVEVFLPKIRQEDTLFGKTRTVTKALFPGYFFALYCPSVNHDAVRYAEGVVRVLGAGNCPVPIAVEIIAAIRDGLEPDGFIRLKPEVFQAGDKVTIEDGPFAGWMGRVEREWNDGRRVLILLQTIQQARLLVERQALVRRCD